MRLEKEEMGCRDTDDVAVDDVEWLDEEDDFDDEEENEREWCD